MWHSCDDRSITLSMHEFQLMMINLNMYVFVYIKPLWSKYFHHLEHHFHLGCGCCHCSSLIVVSLVHCLPALLLLCIGFLSKNEFENKFEWQFGNQQHAKIISNAASNWELILWDAAGFAWWIQHITTNISDTQSSSTMKTNQNSIQINRTTLLWCAMISKLQRMLHNKSNQTRGKEATRPIYLWPMFGWSVF